MNREIALLTPAGWWVLYLSLFGFYSFAGANDSHTLNVIGSLGIIILYSGWVLWPNFVRAATLSEDAVLIKDKYFYCSVIMAIFAATFVVADFVYGLEALENSPLFLFAFFIFAALGFVGAWGLYCKSWRVFGYDAEGDLADSSLAALKSFFAFGYIPFGIFFIHRGLLRYRAKMGWSNDAGGLVRSPEYDEQRSIELNIDGVKNYGPKQR